MKAKIATAPNKNVVISRSSSESLSTSYPYIITVKLKTKAISPSAISMYAPAFDVPRLVSGMDATPSTNRTNPPTPSQNAMVMASKFWDCKKFNSEIGAIQKNSKSMKENRTAFGNVILYPNAFAWSTNLTYSKIAK